MNRRGFIAQTEVIYLINELNFAKFNGCARQAYLIEHGKDSYKSRQDKVYLSSRLRDIQRDMLNSFPPGVRVFGDVRNAALDTKHIIEKEEQVVFNATFLISGASARCDVIMRNGDAYDIYAVRPTSRYTRWIDEVLYCKIIMEKAGFKAGNCYVGAIDKEESKGSILSLYNVDNKRREKKIAEKLNTIFSQLKAKNEPGSVLSKQCGACPYLSKCFETDENSIFSLKSIQFNKKMSLYQRGVKTIDEYVKLGECDAKTLREIAVRSTDEDVYNKEEIKVFLNSLKYPLGFLDFETMEVFVPNDAVIKPMDTVITQFSYHLIEKEGDTPKHFEFIGDGESYCEREAAKKLIECIKSDHTVLMYSDYERICIERVIARLPVFKSELEAIKNNLVDLEKPFSKKMLVNRRMEGKSSLKKVLPALYPDDDNLDYTKMKIQNGQQAESVYARLCRMSPEEKEIAIRDLKEYCALDTLAMIKLWEKLEFYGKMV